jgi:hypothetical protein
VVSCILLSGSIVSGRLPAASKKSAAAAGTKYTKLVVVGGVSENDLTRLSFVYTAAIRQVKSRVNIDIC